MSKIEVTDHLLDYLGEYHFYSKDCRSYNSYITIFQLLTRKQVKIFLENMDFSFVLKEEKIEYFKLQIKKGVKNYYGRGSLQMMNIRKKLIQYIIYQNQSKLPLNKIKEFQLPFIEERQSIESVGFSAKPLNALIRSMIFTVEDLLNLPYSALISISRLGEKSMEEIFTKCHEQGYYFSFENNQKETENSIVLKQYKEKLRIKIKEREALEEKVYQTNKEIQRLIHLINEEDSCKVIIKI